MRPTLLMAAAAAISAAPFAAFAQGTGGGPSADALLDHADRPKLAIPAIESAAQPAPDRPAATANPADDQPSAAEIKAADRESPADVAAPPPRVAPAAMVEPRRAVTRDSVRRETTVREKTPPAPESRPVRAETRERSVERVSRRAEARVEREPVRDRVVRDRRAEPARRLARADGPPSRGMIAEPTRRPARVYELPDGRLLVIRPRPERYYRVTVVEEY